METTYEKIEDFKFTKQMKEAWLTALKSGEYKQGKNFLYRTTEEQEEYYCCLGVLAKVLKIEIDELNDACLLNGKNVNYKIFNQLFMEEVSDLLTRKNDYGTQENFLDVIPFIEELQTVD